MSGVDKLKDYRPPFVSVALAWIFTGLWLVLGLSMVTIGPSERDWGGTVIGALMLLVALGLVGHLATSRLTVTPAGVVSRNYLRRKFVSWAEIQSFDVGPSSGRMRYPTVVIRRKDGSPVVTCVASFTRTYPARIADELRDWQRQLEPAPLAN
jgi:Bacterial PH domain